MSMTKPPRPVGWPSLICPYSPGERRFVIIGRLRPSGAARARELGLSQQQLIIVNHSPRPSDNFQLRASSEVVIGRVCLVASAGSRGEPHPLAIGPNARSLRHRICAVNVLRSHATHECFFGLVLNRPFPWGKKLVLGSCALSSRYSQSRLAHILSSCPAHTTRRIDVARFFKKLRCAAVSISAPVLTQYRCAVSAWCVERRKTHGSWCSPVRSGTSPHSTTVD